jgi:hypothetical protein
VTPYPNPHFFRTQGPLGQSLIMTVAPQHRLALLGSLLGGCQTGEVGERSSRRRGGLW